MQNKKIAKNLIISVTVQIVYLLVSFILNLVVPKFLNEYQYAYWQTFVLYVTYVGFLHLGLLDGFLLRYSQYDYDELDKKSVRSQFVIMLNILTLVAIIGVLFAFCFLHHEQKVIVIFVCIGIVTKNIVTYTSHLYQVTNKIGSYAIITMIQRITYGGIILLLIILDVQRFELYCLADIFGDGLAILYSVIKTPKFFIGSMDKIKSSYREWRTNVSSGAILMLSNWSSMLLLGVAKIIIQSRWGELTFGKIALSFSVTNLFISFLTAVSIVLFPTLKRMEQDHLPDLYESLRKRMVPFLLLILLLYFPGCWLLELFLPNYAESTKYIGIILPLIVFTSKTNLLSNNYLKAYRKEKSLLMINLITTVVSTVCFIVCAFVVNNLSALLVCVVFAFAFNSTIAEVCITKILGTKQTVNMIVEIIVAIAFLLVVNMMTRISAMLVYVGIFVAYLLVTKLARKKSIKKRKF